MTRRDRQTAGQTSRLPPPGRTARPAVVWPALLVLAAASVLPIAALAQAGPAVPVRVGGDRELAACEARGTLNARGGTSDRVDISSGPTPGFRPLDRVPVGLEVFTCDENGTFVGIIYGEGDCGLSEPQPRRAAYRGACASGWVHNSAVDPSDPNAV